MSLELPPKAPLEDDRLKEGDKKSAGGIILTPGAQFEMERPKVLQPGERLFLDDAPASEAPQAATHQETGPGRGSGEAPPREELRLNLSTENKDFLSRMSEGGKKLTETIYEKIYKTPGINRIAAKLEISYNQFWADTHQKKAVELKTKMDGFDAQTSVLEQSKKELEEIIESFKKDNSPGAESLQLKIKDIERQQAGLLNKKDRIQSKFEAQDNKLNLYTNERDRVVDKLISYYNEKLEPMEAKLEEIGTSKDRLSLSGAVMEVRHKEKVESLDALSKRKQTLENTFKQLGYSDRQIKKEVAIKILEDSMQKGRAQMRAEQEDLLAQKAKIDQKVAEADEAANPYRDKREQYVRVKAGRPLDMVVKTRTREEVFEGEEEVSAHVRKPAEPSAETSSESSAADTGSENSPERKENERWTMDAYIIAWNAYLKEKYKTVNMPETLNKADLLKATRLPADQRLEPKDIKNILDKYYKFKKIKADKFKTDIDNFLKEKVEVKK